MKPMLLALGLAIIMSSAANAGEPGDEGSGNTTIVRNGNSVAIVTQSGDPDKAVVRIEKKPGRTVIYRKSGGNTSIVTQSSDPRDIPPESLPPWMRELLQR
ncbi:MAG TPA: hypothetical protein VFL51_09845 [Pseudolabrys sp.]|nr:hypothetical protein [Pseudolabrys sp.]